ncbi:bacillithiol biosynthesis deacetylase BshB2 [Niallia taxi]|uniref:bacillithiol biosynthesis deacetylase BshB2 n=1 Tax=Niallia taxi TaxID=2499688 RepID=UPI00119FFC8A|nr:bacillithiol biosynthesis deacetylase BshB2 [Niallia taxi]MED3964241.1 bacillithiol biosynthesis deacetylase BshB2 [Niallia taxi]WOD63376.1 bacillithiol biosynthesis deacetylase BshB2 [Niallia taxi]
MEKERHVLVIFPHPDDEAFSVSGTIAKYIHDGTPVTYACLTLGQMGRNLGSPPFATRETLPDVRREELMEAARVLGLEDLRMLGYRDKTIEFLDESVLVNEFTGLIEELNPSLIISFYPGYSVHPDHDATAEAVVRTLEKMDPAQRPKLLCLAFSRNCIEDLGEPDVHIDVQNFAEKKIATIAAHRSQTQLYALSLQEGLKNQDPAILERLYTERLWTYKFK